MVGLLNRLIFSCMVFTFFLYINIDVNIIPFFLDTPVSSLEEKRRKYPTAKKATDDRK
jgi:hypothetical protein